MGGIVSPRVSSSVERSILRFLCASVDVDTDRRLTKRVFSGLNEVPHGYTIGDDMAHSASISFGIISVCEKGQ